ncbi:MAG: YgiQ family radical SAM protein, partial [Desulfobacula sp. RIFOXYB2_FULL_45_6]
RAVIAYANLVRQYFKQTRPLVLGGIEASLRRIAHYDFWSDSIRRSILFDARADYLLYGMAHGSILKFASALKEKRSPADLKGVAWISKEKKGIELPSYEAVKNSKDEYIRAFQLFYENNDPLTAETLCQKHQDRYLVINPPEPCSTTKELDHIHSLEYERDLHPFHKPSGTVRALDTIKFSIPTHYGCYGECHFCAITVHQGRTVCFRSEASIVEEAETISRLPDFKGYILDLGGPTANMYGFECKKKLEKGACKDKGCLFPAPCRSLLPDHSRHMRLIRSIEKLPGIKKVFISSGIRYDLILSDTKNGGAYLEKIVADNVSGQMKIAPEHTVPHVLTLMGKQPVEHLQKFKQQFDHLSKKAGKPQFLTYYLIAAHPGCRMKDMQDLKRFCIEHLKTIPEQVQIFTPTPSTWSTLMYYTGIDPFSMKPVFVEKDPKEKEKQKQAVTVKSVRKKYKK